MVVRHRGHDDEHQDGKNESESHMEKTILPD